MAFDLPTSRRFRGGSAPRRWVGPIAHPGTAAPTAGEGAGAGVAAADLRRKVRVVLYGDNLRSAGARRPSAGSSWHSGLHSRRCPKEAPGAAAPGAAPSRESHGEVMNATILVVDDSAHAVAGRLHRADWAGSSPGYQQRFRYVAAADAPGRLDRDRHRCRHQRAGAALLPAENPIYRGPPW
jgi:hypothetical protein